MALLNQMNHAGHEPVVGDADGSVIVDTPGVLPPVDARKFGPVTHMIFQMLGIKLTRRSLYGRWLF